MKDTSKIVYEWLAASGTGLYTLCGTRVYTPMLPPAFHNTQAGIVYSVDSEFTHPTAEVHSLICTFKCYGGSASFTTARSVYFALHDRLHGAAGATTTGAIMMAFQLSAQALPPDPDEGWPAHMARFAITIQ